MSPNPYDNPEFAKDYALSQADRSKNLYEFEVTHPAIIQFLDSSVNRVLDYGCGTGIFTAGLAGLGRAELNLNMEFIGTDASAEMLKYAAWIQGRSEGLTFEKWDASLEVSPLGEQPFDRVFAKLVLNYVSGHDLEQSVMPRLRESLTDDGLLVAVLPNPLREAGYSRNDYEMMNELSIDVGNFSGQDTTRSYHHTYESVMQAAASAGFQFGKALGLPDVRFAPYKKSLMRIAHPMPMIFDTLNAAKRWVYVFGATESAGDNFNTSIQRFEAWRKHHYPEIADRAHIRVADQEHNDDTVIPIDVPHDALYDYVGASDRMLALTGKYAENLTPKQKIQLSKQLAKIGLRESVNVKEFLIAH